MQSLWGVDDARGVVEHWQLVQESALMSARMVVCITVEVAKKCSLVENGTVIRGKVAADCRGMSLPPKIKKMQISTITLSKSIFSLHKTKFEIPIVAVNISLNHLKALFTTEVTLLCLELYYDMRHVPLFQIVQI
jgi:hypothetical protein